eukprot:TRINITY_DN5014_c0_g1_i1.p1 TRINITY_DN5014_c0_g1~~TRINITY_DN5014_c0_g1_i1.p1  ORF type:complete len:215 (+),score=46.48 TRINITY_DN5014_c0_g1_i1:92-736(+)
MKSASTNCFSEHYIFMAENGDLIAFGSNSEGECGTGTKNHILTPTKIMNNPNIKSIVLGSYHSLYLEKNGDLYGFGRNSDFQLGFEQKMVLEPTKIETGVLKVGASYSYSIIQKMDVFIILGSIGLKKGQKKEYKIDNVSSFSCGKNHLAFLKRNGEVWMVGSNNSRQCGLKKIKEMSEPTLLITDPNIISVTCGYLSTFLLSRENSSTIMKFC